METKPANKNLEYNKNKYFKPKADIEYAITITPNPRNYEQYSPVKQHRAMIDDIMSHYKHIVNHLILYAELNQQGNVHYHGVINIKDVISYKAKTKKHIQEIGFRLLKPILEYVDWIEYCTKDKEDMEIILNTHLPIEIKSYIEQKKQIKLKQKLRNSPSAITTPDIMKYLI